MFAQFTLYKNAMLAVIAVGLVFGLYFYISSLKSDITELRMTIKDMNVELANEKLQSTRYKSALDSQNEHIKQLSANDTLLRAKLVKWKNKPAIVKYETIYKTKEVKSDDCKEIKNRLDFVKQLDFSEL